MFRIMFFTFPFSIKILIFSCLNYNYIFKIIRHCCLAQLDRIEKASNFTVPLIPLYFTDIKPSYSLRIMHYIFGGDKCKENS